MTAGGVTTRVQVQGRIHVNDGMALAASACTGITLLDRLLVEQELASDALIELLTHYSLTPGPLRRLPCAPRRWR